jgi:type II secretory ATPase GspE/PulE/Tfp pilus assembly ATPase PilB-like protein
MKKKEVDFRVSSLPVKHGEKFVLRALDKANLSKGLENAGFSQHQLGLFMKAIKKPYGICLVTGPTGSGKSTTLYSILNKLNLPEKHLVTIEDPVEYQVEGLTQIPINHEIQMTFSSALRAVLRQSPDVVMVGEIRDQETADIAIKASLTGQFILSTLHTNDAIGAVTRLADMGVEPFLLASSLVMTSAQRLCRKICTQCRMEYTPPERVYEKLGIPKDTVLYVGKGCEKCHGSGYSGREAVIEVLVLDEGIRDMIVRRASEKEIAEYARLHAGFRTLREDIMDKCIRGVTTVEEVFRITA